MDSLAPPGPFEDAHVGTAAFASPANEPSALGSTPNSPSELKLQRQLNQPWRLRLENVVKRRRAYIAIGQPEIRMVQQIKELRPELELFSLRHCNVLECRKVPIRVTGTLGDVAACRAELL